MSPCRETQYSDIAIQGFFRPAKGIGEGLARLGEELGRAILVESLIRAAVLELELHVLAVLLEIKERVG